MKPHIVIDLKRKEIDWDYMGFGLNRKFNPCLRLTIPAYAILGGPFSGTERITVVFEGYHIMWNLLDTACYRQPLPRSHFNDVLKHRWDEPSLEVIKDVLVGGDLPHIVVQGDIDRDVFIVRTVQKPWGGLKSPVLNRISNIMLTEDAMPAANGLFWEPYNAVHKTRDGKSRMKSVACIVGVWKIDGGCLVIRSLMVEKTQSFVFLPHLEIGDSVYGYPRKPKGCPTTATEREICHILQEIYCVALTAIPLINEKTPTFTGQNTYNESTLSKYKRNGRIVAESLGIYHPDL